MSLLEAAKKIQTKKASSYVATDEHVALYAAFLNRDVNINQVAVATGIKPGQVNGTAIATLKWALETGRAKIVLTPKT